MITFALLVIAGVAIALRLLLPVRLVKFFWYLAAVCLLLSVAAGLTIAYAVNFDKQFFLWFPIHPYILAAVGFLLFMMSAAIIIGIAGKRSRPLP
jgi:hypothetical protein